MRNNYNNFIPYLPFAAAGVLSVLAIVKLLFYHVSATNKLTQRLRPGFTIIEVVVVLAIAALIIVIVLLAVAGLQRSQRTKAAQNAAGRLLTQEINYESDQGGNTSLAAGYTLPGTVSPSAGYIGNAALPSTATVTQAAAAGTAASGVGNFVYGPGGTSGSTACDATNAKVVAVASSTVFAVAYYSETAGASICIHN